MAEKARSEHPSSPIYLIGELVHNEGVIADLAARGFVVCSSKEKPLADWIQNLPEGSVIVFSAHGHDPKLEAEASKKHLIVYDATCRYVASNATLLREQVSKGGEAIYIGEPGHDESAAAIAIDPAKIHLLSPEDDSFSYQSLTTDDPLVIAQTTMDEADISKALSSITAHLPKARLSARRCPPTARRQEAIRKAPAGIEAYIIMGSKTSNNTAKLMKIARDAYPQAHVARVLNLAEAKKLPLTGMKHVALASGASTSIEDFNEVLSFLHSI
jgi:4-hydroxy-3-methylbut-2-enyl diphosphate reductase